MTARLFTSALFAGLVAGLIAVLLQFSLMESLILEAEEYESGAKVHFNSITNETNTLTTESSHDDSRENQFTRFTLAFSNVFLIYVGWGLLMVVGFAIAERYGHNITLQNGVLWGVGGFASVYLVPGIGLSPELPGIPAADLFARQTWWVGTVIASGAALTMFAYGRKPVFVAVGIALLVIPQLIGAPKLEGFSGIVPPELSAEFVSRSLAIGAAGWAVLGLSAAYFWNRKPQPATVPKAA